MNLRITMVLTVLLLMFLSPLVWAEKTAPTTRPTSMPVKAKPKAPANTAAKQPKATKKAKKATKAKAAKTQKKKPLPLAKLNLYSKVMGAELNRYWALMKKRKLPRPYYMLFHLLQTTRASIAAKDGLIWASSNTSKKPSFRMNVRLRVGNYQLDNSGREGYDWRAFRHMLPASYILPQSFDTAMFKKHIWKLTDRRLKEGMARYHRKRYVRSLKAEIKEKDPDFSKEKPVRMKQAVPTFTFDAKKWKGIARRVSAFAKTNVRIVSSSVSIGGRQNIDVMIDTNGMHVRKQKTIYMYTVSITYLSPKREYLSNVRLGYVDAESKLPNEARLKKLTKLTMQELINQANAKEGKPDQAPAILMPGVAGVLFHEALGHRLEGQRMVREGDGRTFRSKVGQRIIPTFLTIFDDPTLTAWQGQPLNGYYLVDDQGVRSQRVTLIEKGILRNFLMSRKPLDTFKSSNGHGRSVFGREPFSRMGSLLVKSTRSYSPKVLRAMLLKEARRQGKKYGYILERSTGGYTHTRARGIQSFKNRPIVIYRVDAKTGKQTLIKGLEMIGTPLTVVNHILATGTDYGIFNGFCGAESGYVPVSAIAPSVLLKTVELQRVKIPQKKGFLLKPPFATHHKAPAARRKAPTTRRKAPAARRKAPAARQ